MQYKIAEVMSFDVLPTVLLKKKSSSGSVLLVGITEKKLQLNQLGSHFEKYLGHFPYKSAHVKDIILHSQKILAIQQG